MTTSTTKTKDNEMNARKPRWFWVDIENCKLQPNSARPRNQKHMIHAVDEAEARRLAPVVFQYLWAADTRIGRIEAWI